MGKKARFIVFEGIDGSGKTTQAKALQAWLQEKKGIEALYVRDPGTTPEGEALRALALDRDRDWSKEALFLLFLSARRQLIDKAIRPALRQGCWVVGDRFSDSTTAYQLRGEAIPRAQPLISWTDDELVPDLVFVLDVPVAVSRQRTRHMTDRYSARDDAAFFERLRHYYTGLTQNPGLTKKAPLYRLLDGLLPVETLSQSIHQEIEALARSES